MKSVIVPLDGSSIAEQVLPHVVDMAKALSLKIVLVRVSRPLGDYYHYPALADVGALRDLSKEDHRQAAGYLSRTADQLRSQGVSSVDEQVLEGDVASAIVDYAQEVPDSMIAMTTHGRSGVGRWFMGSVADKIIRGAAIPVFLIRAQGDQ